MVQYLPSKLLFWSSVLKIRKKHSISWKALTYTQEIAKLFPLNVFKNILFYEYDIASHNRNTLSSNTKLQLCSGSSEDFSLGFFSYFPLSPHSHNQNLLLLVHRMTHDTF